MMSEIAPGDSDRERRCTSCKLTFSDALAEEGSEGLILLAIVGDDEGKTTLPKMPGGRGGSLRLLSRGGIRAEGVERTLAFILFHRGNLDDTVFDRWLAPASQSGAVLLADRLLPGIRNANNAAALWAACVAATLWDTSWKTSTEFANVFQFPAFAASVETWNLLIQGRAANSSGSEKASEIREVAIGSGDQSLRLISPDRPPFAVPREYSELFRLFASKVSCGAPFEVVPFEQLNYAVGVQQGRHTKASDALRTAIRRLNDHLNKWATPSNQRRWIEVRRGQGYCLNNSIEWRIDDPALADDLARYSQSVWSTSVPPGKMAANTPVRGQRLPVQPRHDAPRHEENDD